LRMRRTGYVARMGKMRNAGKIFVGKPERKRQVGRYRRTLEDNIRTDLKEIGSEIVDSMHLALDGL